MIARDTAYVYARRGIDPGTAGRELGVRAVLTGTVAQTNADLSVTAQLLAIRDGRRIWSAQYDRRLADLRCPL